jgi:hypothetical protein
LLIKLARTQYEGVSKWVKNENKEWSKKAHYKPMVACLIAVVGGYSYDVYNLNEGGGCISVTSIDEDTGRVSTVIAPFEQVHFVVYVDVRTEQTHQKPPREIGFKAEMMTSHIKKSGLINSKRG